MKALNPVVKKASKNDRERKVLIGLVEHYLKTGRPVGSNTLKDLGFEELSSATIRNYFANLESEGFLIQQHTSGGRIPTEKAYRLYAEEAVNSPHADTVDDNPFEELRTTQTRNIASFLQKAAEQLAVENHAAVFLSAPRFEQDFIVEIKLMIIDAERCLCLLVTDFGQVITEILYTQQKLNLFTCKRIEAYFNWRLTSQNKPEIEGTEEELAQKLYNELMMRYVVNYTNFSQEEILRTGLSELLTYPEFHDPNVLANSLALFENTHGMRLLLKDCCKHDTLKFWIGEDLIAYSPNPTPNCTVIAIPYYVNNHVVGAVGLLSPLRTPYRSAFTLLQLFSNSISEALTNNLYKFKITIKKPKQQTIAHQQAKAAIGFTPDRHLLEDKRETPHSSRKKV